MLPQTMISCIARLNSTLQERITWMNTVKLRNVEVGVGAPKVIVPIVGRTRGEIVAKGKELVGMPFYYQSAG